MTKAAQLRINPQILKWAREELGYSTLDLANKLHIEENKYTQWEEPGADIPLSVLREISKILKRQVAVFFLLETPKKTKKPTDYRNLGISRGRLSPNSLLAIRRAEKFKAVLLELNSYEFYETKYAWLSAFDGRSGDSLISQKQSVPSLRRLLGYSLDQQLSDASMGDAYNHWRDAFENNLGIYVFQFTMPTTEIQGFSYSDSYPFCIAVNAKYSVASRIFSLSHELGHILKRQSGLCIPDDVKDDQSLEFECNSFAGRLLLPDTAMHPARNKDEILKRATKLKVSSEVYLRRLRSLGLVSDDDFFSILQEIRDSVKPAKGFGVLTPLQKSVTSRGQGLFNSVLDALNKNRMSYERASDILEIKIDHLIHV